MGPRPKHQGSLGIGWTSLEHLTADASLRAVGRQFDSATGHSLGGFATLDLRLGYDLTEAVQVYGREHRVAGWPVIAPGDGMARFVTWLQVCDVDLPRHVDPNAYFLHRARAEGVAADVGLLTAAEVARFAL